MRTLLALFALGLLIFAHELGHLLFARVLGIRPSHIVFGFGPPLWTYRRGGVRFTLGAVPLGGMVELDGENPHRGSISRAPAGYSAERPWKRLVILLGGPFANGVCAVGALFALYVTGTHLPVPLTVGAVAPGSPAATAQLRPGDRIAAVNGQPIRSWGALVDVIERHPGDDVQLELDRGGPTPARLTVRPLADAQGGGRIGVSQQYVYRVLAPGPAFHQALQHTRWLAHEELSLAIKLIRGARGLGLETAGRMARTASVAASSGLDAALRVLAGLSVALALFYLIPLPALDGGRMLLVAGEAIFKRRLDPRILTLVQTLGLIVLISLFVWIALTDARRLIHLAQ